MRSVLVLNADYLPLNVATLSKAFKLLVKRKAELVVSEQGNPIVTDKKNYDRPTVIRLTKYINHPYKKIPLTRQNLFRRDGHTCGYCSSKKDLTVDHILPKSRGGKNSWENLVTCCGACNRRKDDRTPEEANMILKHKVYVPSSLLLLMKTYRYREDWAPYIFGS